MKKLITDTVSGIKQIKYLVDNGVFKDENTYPLDFFRHDRNLYFDLINQLEDTAGNLLSD